MDGRKGERKNLLSIDGGISGLPALYILDELFSRCQFDQKSDEELLPCEHFDMVIATGQGVLVAILIGKLRLTISKAIEAYMKLTSALPAEAAKDDEERKRNSDAFERSFVKVLEDAGFDAKSPMVNDKEMKVIACASDTANASIMYPIRSYRTRGAAAPPCTILQAACASVASPDKFLPVTVGSGHKEVVLADAMIGYANPTKEMLLKAQEAFGEEVEVSTIISIGAGKVEIRANGIGEGLKRGLVLCEQVHEELQTRLGNTDVYYRFNVDRELGREPKSIFGGVSAYLGEKMVSNRLDDAIESVKDRPRGVSLQNINSISVVEIALKPRPSLVSNFIGRQDILSAMHHTHINNRSIELQTPAITVLSGIGGSGKTQTALKFALDFEKVHPGALVFFVNANSEDHIKTDLEALIRSRGSSYRTKSFEDALIYLATEVKDWLMIFDNADDPSVRLFPFIPKCTSGSVIVTTRNSNHAALSTDSHHHIEGLSTNEAVELILTVSRNEKTEANRAVACQIVDELGCLPLALAQAGGYILVNKCLSQYLELYHKNRAELLESSEVELPQDYQSTVATTIRMSIDQLPAESRNLMRLLSEFDATSIAHEIIAKAANRRFQSVVMTEEVDRDPRTLEYAEVLMKIMCPSGEWSEIIFGKMIRQCLHYSLLRLTTQGDTKFYSIHVLIQSYLQSYQQPIQHCQPNVLMIRLLGAANTDGQIYEHLAFNRLLAPHLKRVNRGDIIEPGDHFGFGQVFYDVGDIKSSVDHQGRKWKQLEGIGSSGEVIGIYRKQFGPEDSNTLWILSELALDYQAVGRYQEALKLDEEVLEIRTRKLGIKHADTLISMNNLSMCYGHLDRHQESLELREKVVDMRKIVLGTEHPETLRAMGNLAVIYRKVGRQQEALKLDEESLEMRRRVLGFEHPDTLLSMVGLAASYRSVGRRTESLELGQAVLKLRIRISGYEHPRTLEAMSVQLSILQKFRMLAEMDELLQVALPLYEKVLGLDHPDTVWFKGRFQGYIGTTESR